MFGRSKTKDSSLPPTHQGKEGGKGRPTPTRRDAEAARRERLKKNLKPARGGPKQTRAQRAEQNAKVREGMRTGDERYLMARDKGPVKRFIRDWVDVRISFIEFLLPALGLLIVMGFVPSLRVAATQLQSILILLIVVDVVIIMIRLGPALKRRFGESGESTRGWRLYAVMRSMQLRPLRVPKPQRKWMEKLPERY